MSNYVYPNYEFGGPLPQNFGYNSQCPLNEIAFILPGNPLTDLAFSGDPNVTSRSSKPVCWEKKPLAPSSLKHLYSEKLFDYQHVFGDVPKRTLYDHDFSRTYATGLGRQKIIGGGHYKVWPLTNWHVLENQDYTDEPFPVLPPQYFVGSEIASKPSHTHTNYRGLK
jgi:hypothetical protein